ncbi:MAG: GGDEF domain-containing protein [Acidimicrobiales bacterium]
MQRFGYTETAAGQASLLFVAAGTLGLLSRLAPNAGGEHAVLVVNVVAVAFGIVVSLLPWDRWDPRATLALVPAAFALIVVGQWLDPAGVGSLYALWFVVVFCWVGTWHRARTSLLLAPLAAVTYMLPFLPGGPAASPAALATVIIAIPIAIILAEVLAAKTAAMRRAQCALEDAAALLERANLTDDLTGVGNRRRANALLDTMAPGDAVALLDLDHFKMVNDTLGHAEGDRVLMELGKYLLDAVRDADCVARFGGEEFLILLRGAGDEAGAIIERLLAGWRGSGFGVTLSAGVAIHVAGCGPTTTLKRADGLLYQAKADGRDRVVTEHRITPRQMSA